MGIWKIKAIGYGITEIMKFFIQIKSIQEDKSLVQITRVFGDCTVLT